MDQIQEAMSLLEHALPAQELLWDWWTENTRTPFDTVKTLLFLYVLTTYTLRLFRHVRARGLRRTVVNGCVWTSKVYFSFQLFAVPRIQSRLFQFSMRCFWP